MEVQASLKFARISPKKVRPLLKNIRGQRVGQVLSSLKYSPSKAGRLIRQVIASASANAVNNYNLKADNLRVKSLVTGDGPRYKRYWFRSRGSADQLLKRTAHIAVVLEEIKPTLGSPKPQPKTSPSDTPKTTTPASKSAQPAATSAAPKTKSTAANRKGLNVGKIFRRTTNK